MLTITSFIPIQLLSKEAKIIKNELSLEEVKEYYETTYNKKNEYLSLLKVLEILTNFS